MSQLPRLIKKTISPFDVLISSVRREDVTTILPNGTSLTSVLDFIDTIKEKGKGDTIILHRDSGGHIMKVEWRTIEKQTI